MNYWNNSANINPHYCGTTLADMREIVTLECMECGMRKSEALTHSMSNEAIMRSFPGWTAKGFRNQSRTRCPNCRERVKT